MFNPFENPLDRIEREYEEEQKKESTDKPVEIIPGEPYLNPRPPEHEPITTRKGRVVYTPKYNHPFDQKAFERIKNALGVEEFSPEKGYINTNLTLYEVLEAISVYLMERVFSFLPSEIQGEAGRASVELIYNMVRMMLSFILNDPDFAVSFKTEFVDPWLKKPDSTSI